MRGELILWRRHLRKCAHREEGRGYTKCHCPIWCDGYLENRRLRYSMNTTNWERAERLLDRVPDPRHQAPEDTPVAGAVNFYLEDCVARELRPATVESYRRTLAHFLAFCDHERYLAMQSLTLAAFTAFRSSRRGRDKESPLKSRTQRKEIECLRAFCAFAVDHGWIAQNFAKKLRPPKDVEPATLPFESYEVQKILDCCGRLSNHNAGSAGRAQLRARALVLLLLYSGLRISDAAKLERSRLDPDGRLLIRIMKTGSPLYIRLPESVVKALAALPVESAQFFFWSGRGKITTMTGSMRRTMDVLKKLTGINVHPHRFRDTFAVRLLENDVPIRTVQLLLGHTSVRTTERHYAHFVRSQQKLLDQAVATLDFESSDASGSGDSPALPHPPNKPVENASGNSKRDVRRAAAAG